MTDHGVMDFDEALAYLDRHVNLEKMAALAGRTEGLSLDRVKVLASVLGDPQMAYPVIQVTGTNGKGSTARIISALLAVHDLTVGTFTSPHVEEIVERITWAGEPIARDELARVVSELASLEPLLAEELHGDHPSYFELLVAVAYAYFAEVAVDVAVVEVGMLGRFDATNVADAEVAVVTNVGKDHTDGTGDWRRRIAEEKAGIIGSASRLVLGEADPDLLEVFEAEGPAELWVRDRDFGCVGASVALGGRVVDLEGYYGRYDQVFLPLHGAHQADNAACAVAAVEALFGRALDRDLVQEALAGVTLPGRFEVIHRQPLVVLDGAHNPQGAEALAQTLDEEVTVGGRRRWVVGLLAGKDIDEMFDSLALSSGDQLVACAPPTPRAVPADELVNFAGKRGIEAVAVPEVDDAVEYAWDGARAAGSEAEPSTDAVIVTGSMYTVGAARQSARRLGLFL